MSKESQKYRDDMIGILNAISGEMDSICQVARMMADAVEKDELIHAVGTGGHSNLMVEETLWRAGGLAAMDPMLGCGTYLMMGAKRSNIVERTPGYGTRIFDMYGCREGELIIICNAYGINAMTIDTALEAHRRKMKVAAITSTAFCENVPAGHPARHPSGKNLYEIADVWINSHVPLGDANAEIEGLTQKVAGTSVLCNSFVWNLLLIETCRELVHRGVQPPVWCSANTVGGDEANYVLEQKYFPRVKHLR